MAKLILVAGLFCCVVFAQISCAQQQSMSLCVMPAERSAPPAPAMSCQHCCADKPCCLVSKNGVEPVPRPEPLSSERGQTLDHASLAVTLTPIPTFDFLAPPARFRVSARELAVHPARESAPRGAVSCIWLI